MVESPKAFRSILNVNSEKILFRKIPQLNHWLCENRKIHSYLFGKHKRKYNTDNKIDMKFDPDVINSPAN